MKQVMREAEAEAEAEVGARAGVLVEGWGAGDMESAAPPAASAAPWRAARAVAVAAAVTLLAAAVRGTLPLLAVGVGLALYAAAAGWRRDELGLRAGPIGRHWPGVLLVCSVPVLLTALIYPGLAERPFANASAMMWTVSPFAQDLVFAGFLYGWFLRELPGRICLTVLAGQRVEIDRALVLAAACFAAWHLQNLAGGMSTGYVLFQLAYTSAGFVLTGLSRQWTGSFLYMTLSHSAVNWVAWFAG
jgi:membrane protease YdiL (CAAX protease family)